MYIFGYICLLYLIKLHTYRKRFKIKYVNLHEFRYTGFVTRFERDISQPISGYVANQMQYAYDPEAFVA
jgi:hypothetical protein